MSKIVYVRIKSKIENGITLYQPQVKEHWYNSWFNLGMLSYELQTYIFWTPIFGEARTELSRFCYIHKCNFKLKSIK